MNLLPDKDYFSIGEVSQCTAIEAYVLRYWETEQLIRPIRRESGQRRYTKKDIERINTIKDLLYKRKYSIAGAKKELINNKQDKKASFKVQDNKTVRIIKEIRGELKEILNLL